MAEVTAPQAAEIIGTSHQTVFRRVEDGTLPARREGIRGYIYIDVGDLERFAKQYNYRFNKSLAKELAK